jgi:hypothetical protein
MPDILYPQSESLPGSSLWFSVDCVGSVKACKAVGSWPFEEEFIKIRQAR